MKLQNPILRGFNPDPSLCRVGLDYYVATSTFEWFPGVQIHHSRTLETWDLVARPLERAAQLDMRGNPDGCGVWAPSLSYAEGQFWLCYTNVRRYDGNYKDTPNFLVTAPDITGPWSDPIYLNASGFDPSLFHDDDGRKWLVNMVWDHRATMAHRDAPSDFFGGIVLQEYDHTDGRLVGPRRNIFDRSPLGFTEAPHLFKRKEYYYLITAEGGTGYSHAVTHARSRDIAGPYELHPDHHVLTAKDAPESRLQRIGHGQPCDGPEVGTLLHSFLGTRPLEGRFSTMGRESGIEILHWAEDGWAYRRGGNPVPSVNIGSVTYLEPTEEQSAFRPGPLPKSFQWLRSPEPERLFSTEARPGWLRLYGRESIGSWFEQSLVARRQTEHLCQAEVMLDFSPNGFQQQAGIVAYYGRYQFHYLYINGELRVLPFSLPAIWRTEFYGEILADPSFWQYLWNSFYIAVATVVLTLIVGSMAAYVLSHIRFFGSSFILSYLPMGMMFPFAASIVPLFIKVRDIGLLDSPWGVILPQTAFGLGFSILLFKTFFDQLPRELFEAARIDGISYAGFFFPLHASSFHPDPRHSGCVCFCGQLEQLPFAADHSECLGSIPLDPGNDEIPWGVHCRMEPNSGLRNAHARASCYLLSRRAALHRRWANGWSCERITSLKGGGNASRTCVWN